MLFLTVIFDLLNQRREKQMNIWLGLSVLLHVAGLMTAAYLGAINSVESVKPAVEISQPVSVKESMAPSEALAFLERVPENLEFAARYTEKYCQVIKADNALVVALTGDKSRRISHEKAKVIAEKYFEEECKYGLPHGILLSIAHAESYHDPKAVSSARARGLLQVKIIPTGHWAAKKLGLYQGDDPDACIPLTMKPETNIQLGAFILNHYLQKTKGDLTKALNLYSWYAVDYPRKVIDFHKKFMKVNGLA